MPNWKDIDCPICDSKAGQSCGQTKRGAFHWVRTAPHAARKRLAVAAQGTAASLTGALAGIEIENFRATVEERSRFVEGARVHHFLFGDGAIQNTERSFNGFGHEGLRATILFDSGQAKTIQVTSLPLDKLHTI